MKTMILAAIAALSLGVGAAQAQSLSHGMATTSAQQNAIGGNG